MNPIVRWSLVSLAAVGFSAAAARPLPAQGLEGKWWKNPEIATRIGLTDEQSSQIEKIFVKSRPELIDRRADLEKKQFALQQMMDDKTVDPEAVSKQIDEVEAARSQLAKTRAMMLVHMRQVLREDQWSKLVEMRQEQIRRRRKRLMGGRPGGDRPRDEGPPERRFGRPLADPIP
jgi:Spy/CpxP family protein refolding chaperone